MEGLDLSVVERGLERRHLPWKLEYRRACDSTQDLVRAAYTAGARAGTGFVTDWQAAGRGRHGRQWSAPETTALLFSVLLEPPPQLFPTLPLLAGVALAGGIEAVCDVRCRLKWPNDVESEGRKLAGILVERPAAPAAVLGIGVNVTTAAADLPAGATSLLVVSGKAVGREALLRSILNSLTRWYGEGLADPDAVLIAWRARTAMLGRPVQVSLNGVVHHALAEDLDAEGRLVVRYPDGRREALVAGDVSQIRTV